MNSGLERGMRVAGLLIPVTSLIFGAALLNAIAALLLAPLLCAGAAWLWFRLELPRRPAWLPPLALTLAVTIAILTVQLSLHAGFAAWFAPLLAALAATLTLWLLARHEAQCNLCGRRLGSQAVVFRCPRCSMQVCDETCWIFDHRRCRLCLEQRVPVLPIEDGWWLRNAGPRSFHGRCQVCLGSAEQLDLRACPHCRRPQCRDCWDFSNGECARCGKSLPELPAALSAVVAELPEPSESYTR